MDYNATMENEIVLNEELRNYACTAQQKHMTIDIKINGRWNMGHACITDKLIQFNYSAGGKHHFFTPEGFEQFLIKIPSPESIERTNFNIFHSSKKTTGQLLRCSSY